MGCSLAIGMSSALAANDTSMTKSKEPQTQTQPAKKPMTHHHKKSHKSKKEHKRCEKKNKKESKKDERSEKGEKSEKSY